MPADRTGSSHSERLAASRLLRRIYNDSPASQISLQSFPFTSTVTQEVQALPRRAPCFANTRPPTGLPSRFPGPKELFSLEIDGRKSENRVIRKPFVRWPLTAILGLLVLLNIQQGLGALLQGEDWSGDYILTEATVVDSVETEWPGSTSDITERDSFACVPVLEIEVDGVTHRTEGVWLQERYGRGRGPDCMDQAYGQTVPVLMAAGAATPILMDPENPPTAEATSFANLAIAAILLFLLWRLWRPISVPAESES